MKKNILLIIFVGLLVVIGGWFILKNQGNDKTEKVSTPTPVPSDGAIVVKGFNYGFSPKEITVKEGQTVKIRLTSDDSPHTFTIDELGVNTQFTWGRDTVISFTATKKGKFQFYCSVPGHKESGMTGTINVI